MEDKIILELQDEVRKVRKQMAQLNKAVKEPACYDGTSWDPTIDLRRVQALEDYFEAKGYLG